MKYHITCPSCGTEVKIPKLWRFGVETVFSCPRCGQKFKTGYKAGAVLFALALTAAVATANLGAWLFSSVTIPLMALAIIPLWLLYGFLLRRWWMMHRLRTGKDSRQERMSRRAQARQKKHNTSSPQ